MDRWVGKVALVTGASTGIGAEIAKSLVKEGMIVLGLARRLEKLEELSTTLKNARGKFHPRKCDVSEENDLLDSFEWAKTNFGGVDVLVNNAGVYNNKPIIEDNIDSFRNMLNVNVLATAVSIQQSVASMRSRNVAGHIININSTDGHWLPRNENASLYAPTKYSITAITETVRQELVAAKSRIKITSVSPGYVKTDILQAANIPNYETFFDSTPHLQPRDIANAVLYILSTPEYVQVTELTLRPVGEEC